MKKVILCFLLASVPISASSADYYRRVSGSSVIECLGDRISSKPRSDLSMRIERFAVAHGAKPEVAPELAELIATCDHPRVLAAIAAKESNFNDRARGKAGEIGMYQVLPRVHGHPGRTWRDQTKTSERLLNELVSDAGGVLQVAVRRYNGSGPKAAHYAKHVMALARSI
jgi:hypothetical protein